MFFMILFISLGIDCSETKFNEILPYTTENRICNISFQEYQEFYNAMLKNEVVLAITDALENQRKGKELNSKELELIAFYSSCKNKLGITHF